MDKEKLYLTKEGYEKLKQEYERLTNEEKPKAIQRLKEARDLGNLEDNAEYEAAKDEQILLEGKITEIEEMLESAEIINGDLQVDGKISIGSKVTVDIEGSKEQYHIVGSVEADPTNGKVSYQSPVGQALLGLAPGDEVKINLPHTNVTYKIIQIHKN